MSTTKITQNDIILELSGLIQENLHFFDDISNENCIIITNIIITYIPDSILKSYLPYLDSSSPLDPFINSLIHNALNKYQEDQDAMKLDEQRALDEKKWSKRFESITEYSNAKALLKELSVPEAREAEFFKLGQAKWVALREMEEKEAEARRQQEEMEAEARKKEEEKAKLMNAEYLQEKFGVEAGIYCRPEVEKLAKNNFEWFDKWYETKFPSYITKVFDPGVLIVAGDKIKFQNGFGAWQIMSYRCEYDTQAKKVINVTAQGR